VYPAMVQTARVAWIDVARGAAILFVALYHSIVLLTGEGYSVSVWAQINGVLSSVRMPLFFLVSGYLAAGAMSRSWPQLWTKRIAVLVWTLAIWATIRFVYFTFLPLESRHFEAEVSSLLLTFINPGTGLWFLQALAIFLLLARFAARLPRAPVLIGALILSALFTSILSVDSLAYDSMASYFAFFFFGSRWRDDIGRVATHGTWTRAIPLTAGFLVLSVVVRSLGLTAIPGLQLLLSVAGVTAALWLSYLIQGSRVGDALAFFGQRTIYIYVAHVLVIAACISVLNLLPSLPGPFTLVLPVAICAIAVTVSLLLKAGLFRIGARFLYEPPRWFSGAASGRRSATRH
jgi:uncharacterized membrane protein YcfT